MVGRPREVAGMDADGVADSRGTREEDVDSMGKGKRKRNHGKKRQRKRNKVWKTFVRRTFVGVFDDDELKKKLQVSWHYHREALREITARSSGVGQSASEDVGWGRRDTREPLKPMQPRHNRGIKHDHWISDESHCIPFLAVPRCVPASLRPRPAQRDR